MYKDSLRQIRQADSQEDKLFASNWVYERPVAVSIESAEIVENNTEKTVVLESLSDFVEKKLEEKNPIEINGTVIEKKEQVSAKFKGHSFSDLNEFIKVQSNRIPINFFSSRIEKQAKSPKVMFITDVYTEVTPEYREHELKDFLQFFSFDVSSLFSRMISAMGLNLGEYSLSAIALNEDDEADLREEIINEIIYLKPEYIVSLGARATNVFLGADKRIKNHHGQLFPLSFEDQNDNIIGATLMPLFSPKLLSIAPNMKKTAWEDMQKLMEKL